MEEWNLYILFGVGGGLFTFFSSCFCYYKRKDVIRRKQEKIYENERDETFASALTQPQPPVKIGTVQPEPNSNGTRNGIQEEVGSGRTETTAAAVNMTIVNDYEGRNNHDLVGRINSAYETTKL